MSPRSQPRPPRDPLVPPGAIEHHVADMTVTASADVTLSAVQSRLAERGQWLPIDGRVDSTLGDLVLGNSTGPLRLGYGAWRDVLLGIQFRNGLDELITAGGRVLKNVAGYDLTKLLVGSYGCFGWPVTVTTRTWKRPSAALRLTIRPRPDVERFSTLLTTALRPHWAIFTAEALSLGYHGDNEAIDQLARLATTLEAATTQRSSIDDDIAARAQLWPGEIGWRASVPPTKIVEFALAATAASWSADPAFGIVVGPATDAADVERLGNAARKSGGRVIGFSTAGHASEIDCDPTTYALLERLKQALDPENRLAPLPRNRNE